MRLFSASLVLSLLSSEASCLVTRGKDASHGLVVQTTSGELHGFINDTAPQVRQWLGIPYAEAPVGALRFAPPKKKSKGKAIQATAFAPSCMQQFTNSTTVYTEVVPQYLINGGQSEDCLYLNVWAPAASSCKGKKLPVFVYIPGGGFTSGGANSVYKIPDKWIQRTQSHIVVIINYRVNVFGYPNAKGLKAGELNVGLLDQRRAVEWARDNVAAFGGDPERITLWGQSAGGASVSLFGYAYSKDPIITGIIADSGAASTIASGDTKHTNFTSLAGLVGCGNLSPQAELDCVRKVPASTLENTFSNYNIAGKGPSLSFTPIADNVTAFSNTTDRAARGLAAKIPVILGSNKNEGQANGVFNISGPTKAVSDAFLRAIQCSSAAEVKVRATFGLPTYRYLYAGNFTNISPLPWMGAYHSSELPILFGTHYEFRGNSTEYEWQLSYFMESLWLSFASNPNVAPTGSFKGKKWTWPKYNPSANTLSLFASGDTAVQLVDRSVVDTFCGL